MPAFHPLESWGRTTIAPYLASKYSHSHMLVRLTDSYTVLMYHGKPDSNQLRGLHKKNGLYPRIYDIIAAGRQEGVKFGILSFAAKPKLARDFLKQLPPIDKSQRSRGASKRSQNFLSSFEIVEISSDYEHAIDSEVFHRKFDDAFDLLLFEAS